MPIWIATLLKSVRHNGRNLAVLFLFVLISGSCPLGVPSGCSHARDRELSHAAGRCSRVFTEIAPSSSRCDVHKRHALDALNSTCVSLILIRDINVGHFRGHSQRPAFEFEDVLASYQIYGYEVMNKNLRNARRSVAWNRAQVLAELH